MCLNIWWDSATKHHLNIWFQPCILSFTRLVLAWFQSGPPGSFGCRCAALPFVKLITHLCRLAQSVHCATSCQWTPRKYSSAMGVRGNRCLAVSIGYGVPPCRWACACAWWRSRAGRARDVPAGLAEHSTLRESMQRQRRRHSNPTVASARNPFDGRCAISASPKAAAFIVALTSNKAKRVQS